MILLAKVVGWLQKLSTMVSTSLSLHSALSHVDDSSWDLAKSPFCLRELPLRGWLRKLWGFDYLALPLISYSPETGVQSATCREANQVSSKLGGGIIIRSILGLPIDPDVVTLQSGQQIQIPDTIAEAQTVYGRGNIEVEEEGSDRLH